MTDRVTKFRDALGATDSYLHTLDIMVEVLIGKGDVADYAAFCLIIEDAKKQITAAQQLVDEMEDAQ
ncbi:hypothetical protein M0654_03555 [Rhizobium sp. NTR19]|uniref:Uncharacterized protein n=1 Tax=Neorhizobium turbinariae TaxID=2937795 RepID=A0ABT0IMF0_9HYPH|nr:hypothetical protein [Neorhizobium turbinariae]MCK8779055.1 hypothetical protein [Neorhizobium turbinariae]